MNQRNIVVEDDLWNSFKMLNSIEGKSISKMVVEAMEKYLEEKQKDNLILRVNILAMKSKYIITREESNKIVNKLESMSEDELKIVKTIEL